MGNRKTNYPKFWDKVDANINQSELNPAFSTAVAFTETMEGGYVDHPKDKGGATKFGISQAAYPRLTIKSLTKKQARSLYKADYWDKIGGDGLPDFVARTMFDTAVHSGVGTAISHLQGNLNVPTTGILDEATSTAIRTKLYKDSPLGVSIDLLERRRNHLTQVLTKDPSQQEFYDGWIKRINLLEKEILRDHTAESERIRKLLAERALIDQE